jgi:nicotinate-nucleotide adenylyltransferase
VRIGICGGTFDPLHNGHAALVHAALASGQVDRVLVIPSGTPPHKRGDLVSMACYRYEMARRAFAGEPNVDVSDIEILREDRPTPWIPPACSRPASPGSPFP